MTTAELITQLQRMDPDAHVTVSAFTGRDAILTDQFTLSAEEDEDGPSVTISAGWDR